MTVELEYIGKHDAVQVRLGAGFVHVEHGGTVKVTAEQAKSLLDQPTNWAKAGDTKGKKNEESEKEGDS